MPYKLPTFNIEVGIWRNATSRDDPPDVTINACFAQGRREFGGNFSSPTSTHAWYATSYLLLPMGTNIIGDSDTDDDSGDVVEIPLGSTWFYKVLHQERVGLSFDNEHMVAVVSKKGFGFGGGGGGGGAGEHGILMEDSGFVLLESGDNISME